MDQLHIHVKKEKIIIWGLVVLVAFVYTLQVALNHYFFRTYAFDYGFYNQAFWDFAHLRINSNTVFEPPLYNYFQVHPSFTLLLLSPLYWLFNGIFGTYSLLIIQNIFIVAGGYCVFLLIKRKTNDFWIAVLAFLHYNLIWGHFSALSADFIEATVGASMVPLFLLLYDSRKFLWSGLVFLFVILCKENMPIWFIFISITLLLTYKDKTSRWVAGSFALFSIIYLFVLFAIIIPHFEDPEFPYWGFAYSALGESPAEALLFVARNPLEAIRLLFVNHLGDPAYDRIKTEFYTVFLISGGALLFRRPVYLIPFIPIIAQKMYNDSFVRWGMLGFYSIEVVSVLTVFVFLAMLGIKKRWIRLVLFSLLCISTFGITLEKLDERRAIWYESSKENMLQRSFYRSDLDVQKIRRQINEIVPSDGAIAGSQAIIPHYAKRSEVHVFPFVHDATWLVLLKDHNPYPLTAEEFRARVAAYLQHAEWECVLDDYPLLILKKKAVETIDQ
ncbi:MAG: DUF2079 domain-containing protein [Bacteroidales bacterium]|nr:DUF2079 domain-containing protein [Bacteroidales bacterium]